MSRRFYSVTAVLMAIVGCLPQRGLAQDAALLKRLQDAEQAQSLDDAALMPWHLKLSVQLNDPKGKPAETGTIEEWWVGPGKFRRVYAFPSYSATELGIGDKLLRTTGRTQPPYLMRQLLEDELHPVRLALATDHFRPELRSERVEKTLLDCIVLHPPGVSTVDPDQFPRYCFKPGDTLLLLKREFTQTDTVEQAGTFQGRFAAAALGIVMARIEVASQRIDSLSLTTEAEARLDATDGLTEVRNDPVPVPPDPDGPDVIRHGQRGGMPEPMRGSVVIRAVFGSDGRMREATPLASPDADLAKTAIEAVHRTRRDPYEVGGRPVAVEMLIVVNVR
jgi:hypothetical protein